MASVLLVAASAAAQGPPAVPPPQPVPPAAPEAPAAAPAAQEVPAEPPAPPAAQAVHFDTTAGVLLMTVVAEKTADFESLMDLHAKALAASGDEGVRALAAGWKVYRAAEPAPGGANALYVVVVDPVVQGADYSWQSILSAIVAAFPDRQQEVFDKGTSVHAGPMNKLTLTRLVATP